MFAAVVHVCSCGIMRGNTALLHMFVFVDASLFLTLLYPSPVAVCLSHLCQKTRNPVAGLLGLGVEARFLCPCWTVSLRTSSHHQAFVSIVMDANNRVNLICVPRQLLCCFGVFSLHLRHPSFHRRSVRSWLTGRHRCCFIDIYA